MAENCPLNCDQGATFSQQVVYRDSLGALIDLTGYTARMHVRATLDAADKLIELTTENGRIALGGVAGTIDFSIDAATTAGLPAGSFVYDLELVNGSAVKRLIGGTFTVTREVTR